ncbi:MAG: redox-regulated ATPase YchF [Candidatus Omnitrophica bacterium CG07_land_8_20_14_0_80_42_15]|uniref:Redox-regulated ATPase YchF n=1 Tax=Candidatus Aquitaenariimonas noxiae TaxID=1974741 RepID=A0A2J0KYS4_9BACT|nr:MAG: redox-regulated ATPase YchF [Candidatus Omnitrophica bacterium CG07_land_8_20_14_0_80_42_15]
MKIGIIGLPQVGKKTLFELLTHHKPSEKELVSGKPVKSLAEIKDPRFDKLVALYNPEKNVRARIDIEVLPKLEKETLAKGDVFKDIEDLDAICHVVRAFKDEAVYHVDGSVDTKRDIRMVNSELILNDLIFTEKRLERVEQNLKKIHDGSSEKERALLLKIKSHLDKELPLRLLGFDKEEKKTMSSYPFITLKEMILAINISEDDVKNTEFIEGINKEYGSLRIDAMVVSAKLESEIAELESEKEKEEYLKALGIAEPAVDALSRLCIKKLNLISFFTVGPDEVRQWTIRKGSSAPEAAGAIHTDLERGFIRAEVMKYDDLAALGSEPKVKEAGKYYVKGKDYIVEDGDIINIRFNV